MSIHLYTQGRVITRVGGQEVEVIQSTRFPWDGEVAITFNAGQSIRFSLRLRVPDWSPDFAVKVNGNRIDPAALDRGYIRLQREWQPGDRVALSLAMPSRRLSARPELVADLGRLALQRGPFIYCIEEVDTGADVERLAIDPTAEIETCFEPELLGGIATLLVPALMTESTNGAEQLYEAKAPDRRAVTVRAIPYPLWAHRGAGSMAVWLRC